MPYRIALIGCGRVGVWLEDDPLRAKPASHLGGIQKIQREGGIAMGLELAALCDINRQPLDQCLQRWPTLINSQHLYKDYKQLISRENPDIVIIATWTSSHRDIAVYAAQKGVKGIVLEKPAATTLDQAHDIITACRRHQVKLVVNHERRWGPLYRKTKEIIANKTLGDLKAIYGNVLSQSAPHGTWQSLLPELGGGPLLHDGTHLVDMIRYLAGDIVTINGYVKREDPACGTETTAVALLQTEQGIPAFIEAGGMRDYFNFEIDLQFQQGRIKIGNGIKEYFITEKSNRYTGFNDLAASIFPPLPEDSNPFTGAILEVIKAMELDQDPQSSAIDGWKAMEVIFGIYQSAYLKGKTLRLPLEINGHPLKKMFRKGML